MNNRFFVKGGILVDKKLDLVYVDKEGKFYSRDKADDAELAMGLGKISKEIAARLRLRK